MARRKQSPEAEDLNQLKELATLSRDDRLRKILELERKLATAETARKSATAKLKLALSDAEIAEASLQQVLATDNKVTARKIRRLKAAGKGKATAIICANDWHTEENVDPDVIDNLNEFDLDIAKKRISKLWERSTHLLEFARGMSNIRDMVLWCGGDHINGYIHDELIEGNFLGPTEAILFIQDEIATGIDHFLKYANVEHITVLTSYGNHGRSTHKRHISTGYKTSWEWLAYHNLARYYKNNPKVTFQISKGYHNWIDIQGHPVRFHHGDSVKFGGGVGGVHIPLRKKIAQWNKAGKTARLDILGHFHQYSDDWYYVLCGCLVGFNAYAQSIGAEFQRPSQTFIVMDKNEEKVLSVPIFVDDAPVIE
jgi:hypothetical protein